MAKVAVYIDPDGALGVGGHAFIGLTDDSGATKYYGYYPGGNFLYSTGGVRDESVIPVDEKTKLDINNNGIADRIENAKTITSKNISDTQYNTMNNYIQNHIANPGDYALFGEVTNDTDNCATFIGDVLDAGGIGNGFGAIPNGFGQDQKWYDYLNATPEDRANWVKDGNLPWNYNPSGSIAAIRRDPLTLDLNHDGIINTVSLTSSTTFFDLNNDGMSELSGWIAPSEGMLVYDRNNDGQINSNIEQFGKIDKDGFTELKEIGDSNNDNLFDANDTLYNTLKVWTDTNSDGISQSNELYTLRELNITSIDLSKTAANIDSNGNAIIATSTFIQDGQSYTAGAVALATDSKTTDYRGEYELTVDVLFMPWLRGYGDVKDSQIAYSLDEGFRGYAAVLMGDYERAHKEFDSYLVRWSGLDTLWANSGISHANLTIDDKVWIMETFVGASVYKSSIESAYAGQVNSSNSYNSAYVDTQYNAMKSHYYALFVAQAFYGDAFSGSYYSVNQDRYVVTDADRFNESIVSFVNNSATLELVISFASVLNGIKNDVSLDVDAFIGQIGSGENRAIITKIFNGSVSSVALYANNYSGNSTNELAYGTNGNDNLYGGSGNDILYGGAGNDHIDGQSHNDFLYGEDGNDNLVGGFGDDYLDGGAGNDNLNGNVGNDTYYYGIGSGYDNMSEEFYNTTDKIIFKEGLTIDSLTFTKGLYNAFDLIIKITETGETLTIKGWYDSSANKIELFQFADGTTYATADVEARSAFWATDSGETVYGTSLDDVVDGKAGNDRLYGSGGNDTIIGGTGNDYLSGDRGNDTYAFNRSDGQDAVTDYGRTGENDKIVFGEGITKSNVAFYASGSTLYIGYGDGDKITINNQTNSSYTIERFELGDGSYLTDADIGLLMQNITSYASTHSVTINGLDSVAANSDLMEIIALGWH